MRDRRHRSSTLRLVLYSALVAVLFGALPVMAGDSFTGKISLVNDGDTLVARKGTRQVVVQLAGIDAPELYQDHGPQAKSALEQLALKKKGTIEVVSKTGPRNFLARVSIDGQDLSTAMVASGNAWIAEGQETSELQRALDEAKSAKQGIWAQTDPTPPWTYRQSVSR